MTSHEILVAAKGYLLRHGWRQGGYGVHGGPRCLLGAMRSARGEERDDLKTSDVLWDITGEFWAHEWNDAEDRTFDDVIAALDAAILASAPEDTPAPQPETDYEALGYWPGWDARSLSETVS